MKKTLRNLVPFFLLLFPLRVFAGGFNFPVPQELFATSSPTFSSCTITGNISATQFVGSGALLTNLPSSGGGKWVKDLPASSIVLPNTNFPDLTKFVGTNYVEDVVGFSSSTVETGYYRVDLSSESYGGGAIKATLKGMANVTTSTATMVMTMRYLRKGSATDTNVYDSTYTFLAIAEDTNYDEIVATASAVGTNPTKGDALYIRVLTNLDSTPRMQNDFLYKNIRLEEQ